jgi:uncharacterized protein (DUF2147 family)
MKTVRTIVVASSLLAAPALGHAAQKAYGEWARDDGQVRTRIAPCGKAVCAVNTWAKNPSGDEKAGDRLVMTLNQSGVSHWVGSAFDPQRNSTYSMDISVQGNRLTTRGCVMGGFLCRDVAWTRVGR